MSAYRHLSFIAGKSYRYLNTRRVWIVDSPFPRVYLFEPITHPVFVVSILVTMHLASGKHVVFYFKEL